MRPAQARAWTLRIAEAKQYPSVCPYCAVGCDTLIYAKDGAIIDIEGDPNSPINQGTLCPKGAAIYQLHVNPNRLTQVLYRARAARSGRPWGWKRRWTWSPSGSRRPATRPSRRPTRRPTADGKTEQKVQMATTAIFSLGGATMDNEWNHVQQKLMRGLGVVAIENQARI